MKNAIATSGIGLCVLLGCASSGLVSPHDAATADAGAGASTGVVGSGGAGSGGAPGTSIATGGTIGSGGRISADGEAGTGGTLVGAGGIPAVVATGGSGGRPCPAIGNPGCAAGEFCDYPMETCGTTYIPGTCTSPSPNPCPAVYAPVCGCDGKTYINECLRLVAGVSKRSAGACFRDPTACPADLSQIGTWPCTQGLICEFGADPRSGCRSTATCTHGTWVVADPPPCPPITPLACPAARSDAENKACSSYGAYCYYGSFYCQCTNCPSEAVTTCDGLATWQCYQSCLSC